MCHGSNLFVRYAYQLTSFLQATLVLYSAHNCDVQGRNFTKDSLNYNWLLPALSCLFICLHLQSSQSSQSKRFAFLPSRELYRENSIVHVHSHTCLSHMLVVVGLSAQCIYVMCIVSCCFLSLHEYEGLCICSFCLLDRFA